MGASHGPPPRFEDSVLPPSPKIQGRYYLAIFVLASAVLSYQILVTRFFSVMLYYHFAFAAISLAMLGLTRGAWKSMASPSVIRPNGSASNSRVMPPGSRSRASPPWWSFCARRCWRP